jgi:hypothetical protein
MTPKDFEEIDREFDEKFGSKTGGAMPSGLETADNIKNFLHAKLSAAYEQGEGDILDELKENWGSAAGLVKWYEGKLKSLTPPQEHE